MKVYVDLTWPAAIAGSIVLVLVGLYFGLYLLATLALSGDGQSHLKYEFATDDPAAVIPVEFDTSELHTRLDATGHAHGVMTTLRVPAGSVDVKLDDDCRLARITIEDSEETHALRVLGLDASGECEDTSSRESLLAMVNEELVARLEGRLPPLAFEDRSGKEFFAYPDAEVPSLVLAGTLRDFEERVDGSAFFDHEFHDGVYYLGEGACYGRFRVAEGPDRLHVRVIGIGYGRPCWAGEDQACLARMFALFISRPGDPTQAPVASPAASSTPSKRSRAPCGD